MAYAMVMELSMSQRKAVTVKKAVAYRRADRRMEIPLFRGGLDYEE